MHVVIPSGARTASSPIAFREENLSSQSEAQATTNEEEKGEKNRS